MKKCALFLVMRSPYPPYGGEKIRIYEFLEVFNKLSFDVDLIIFEDYKIRVDEYNENIKHLKEKKLIRNSYIIKIPGYLKWGLAFSEFVLKSNSLQVGYFFNNYTLKKIKEILKELPKDYDLIFVHTIRLFPFLKIFSEYYKRSILYNADALSLYFERLANIYKPPLRYIFKTESKRVRSLEKLASTHVDINIFHSLIDIEYLDLTSNENVYAMPITKYPVEKFSPINEDTKKRFLFIANFRSLPNRKSLDFLIYSFKNEKSLPYKISLIGPNLPRKYIKLVKKIPVFEYIGTVESIEKELIDSYGSLCPVFVGAGMQNKILEAIAVGRPVISTYMCASPYIRYLNSKGLDNAHKFFGVFDNKEVMKKKMLTISSNIEYANNLGKTLHEFSNYFSMRETEQTIANILNVIL